MGNAARPVAMEPQPYKRERSIGGSDIGIILGVNPYRSQAQLYDEIISGEVYDASAGREGSTDEAGEAEEAEGEEAEVDELSDNARRGKLLEPVAMELYHRETKRDVVYVPRCHSETFPHFHASPDAAIFYPESVGLFNTDLERERAMKRLGEYACRPFEDGPGVLEIKCPTPRNFKIVKNEGMHPMYYAQLQHYLGVVDWGWGAFAVFNCLTCELYYFDVERDQPFIDAMHEVATRWWERHVVGGVRPVELEVAPAWAGAMVPWPRARIGGEGKYIEGDPAWVGAMLRLREARELARRAKLAKLQAEAEIKTLMGEEELAVVKGLGRVLWKEGVRATFDRNALRQARPLDREKVARAIRLALTDPVLFEGQLEALLNDCAIDVDQFVKHAITRRFRPTFNQ